MRPCVLIVEDDPFIRMDVTDIVETAGYTTVEVANADAAIVELTGNPSIGIVLTDIEMPGSMDGVRLAHAVRDRWPPISLIVMSGRIEPGPGELPDNAVFISKPFRPEQIEDALRRAV